MGREGVNPKRHRAQRGTREATKFYSKKADLAREGIYELVLKLLVNLKIILDFF